MNSQPVRGLQYERVGFRLGELRAVETAPGGPAGRDVRLCGQGCQPTRVGGFCGGTPPRRGFNRPLVFRKNNAFVNTP